VIRENAAETDLAPSTVTVQVPVPEHPPPDQPAKVEVASVVAVSVTVEAASTIAEQEEPQSIPPTSEVTVPPPVPILVTLSE
jgi:hypothetical protein